MSRIIFKCPYVKPRTQKAAAHLSSYVRYVATRDGTDRITQDKSGLPATKKQQDMVARLIRDFPLSRSLFEYEDYQAAPTQGNASEFITRAIEDNYDQIAKRENYVSYIAQRPRAERVGAHGLFSSSDDPLVQKSGEVMDGLIQQMRSGTLENPHIELLTGQLAERLKNTSGKKQYGYLKTPRKAVVDEIVDDLPDRLPLSQQKEFKRIKNLVIQEAVRLDECTEVFTPANALHPFYRGTADSAPPALEATMAHRRRTAQTRQPWWEASERSDMKT